MHADEGHAASSRSSSSTVEKWWSTPPGSQFLAHPQDQPVQLMLRPICFLPAGHSTGRNNSSPEPWLSGRPSHCWQFNQPWWRPSKTRSKPPSLPVLPPPQLLPLPIPHPPHPTPPPTFRLPYCSPPLTPRTPDGRKAMYVEPPSPSESSAG